jgi:hypothetical protein
MAYLEKEDYTISASILHVDEIMTAAAESSGKSQDVIRGESEDTAEAQIRAYAASRYDMAAEFAKDAPDATRARMIIKFMVDISLFHLHFTINPRNIPTLRIKAYESSLETLQAMQEGSMTLIGVPEVTEPLVSTFLNSQRKFISRSFQDNTLID